MATKPRQDQENFYELYRATSIGTTLEDTLDLLVQSQRISPQLAMRVLQNFDRGVPDVLGGKLKAVMKMKGELLTYRNCDDVWKWVVQNVRCTMVDEDDGGGGGGKEAGVRVEKIKIVACRSKE